jgi:uncharacterized protein YegP (UPF0339 family)
MFDLKAVNGQIIATSQVYTSESALRNGIESVRRNSKSKIEDRTVEGFKTMTNPKYEVFLDGDGKYRFHLKAMNGEVVAASQTYQSKISAKKGIESIAINAVNAEIVEEAD